MTEEPAHDTAVAPEVRSEGPVRFGIVGSGWRAEFFARLAALLPERLTLVGAAVRRPGAGRDGRPALERARYLSPEELIAKQRPGFVVACVPWPVNPVVIGTLVAAGTPVLAETPPAPDAAGLRALWERVGRPPAGPGRRAVSADAGARRAPGTGAPRRDRRPDQRPGLLHPRLPRRVDDQGPDGRRVRPGAGGGLPAHRAAARSAHPRRLDRRRRAGRRRPPRWRRSTSAAESQASTTSPTTSGTTGCVPGASWCAAASARSSTTRCVRWGGPRTVLRCRDPPLAARPRPQPRRLRHRAR